MALGSEPTVPRARPSRLRETSNSYPFLANAQLDTVGEVNRGLASARHHHPYLFLASVSDLCPKTLLNRNRDLWVFRQRWLLAASQYHLAAAFDDLRLGSS